MDLAKHRAEVPVRSHEVSPAVPGHPLDPGGAGMLNAPFMGAGLKQDRHGIPALAGSLVVCSNEEGPIHGESADA